MEQVDSARLFLTSRIALIVTAMTFGIRARLMPIWEGQFHLTGEQVGWVAATAFWGFTLAMVFGGPLCDIIGMKRIALFAFIGHLLGVALTIFAGSYWTLFLGTLVIGVANGMVEAACNPLVTALFPDNKTTMLNRFHMWFPGGIVIGGLVSYLMIDVMGLPWTALMGILLIPTVIYGWMFYQLAFPATERVSRGVSSGDMYAAVASPLFIVMVICMLMTAATELGTGQWIQALLNQATTSPILLLVFINGIMAFGRSFAGPIVHRINPSGMLIFSAVFSCLGLYLLSQSSGAMVFVAAAVFAAGVCFFWPTMLGFVAEYVPKSGALGLSIMGGAGMLSTSLIIPYIGRIYDGYYHLAQSSGATDAAANLSAGSQSLKTVAILPFILIFAFVLIHFWVKNKSRVLNTESSYAA